ncbi:MAG: CHAT domain-containing protein [bacterium]
MRAPGVILVALLLITLSGCDFGSADLSEADEMLDRSAALIETRSFDEAERMLFKVLPLFARADEQQHLGKTHQYLGQIYLQRGRYSTALSRFDTALVYFKQAIDYRSELALNLLYGDVYLALHRYNEALSFYDITRQASAILQDAAVNAETEARIGNALMYANRIEEALQSLQSALTFYQSKSMGVKAAIVINAIAEIYSRQGRINEALNLLAQARSLISPSDDVTTDARLQMSMGLLEKQLSNMNNALKFFREAGNALRSHRAGREFEILSLFHIGTTYLDYGRPLDAKRFFTDGVRLAQSQGDKISAAYLQLLITLCDEHPSLGADKAKTPAQLIQAYLQVAKSFEECGHRTGQMFSYYKAGELYESTEYLTRAREWYQKAIDIDMQTFGEYADPELHRFYLKYLKLKEMRENLYAQLAGVYLKMNNPEEAIMIVERASNRSQIVQLQNFDVAIRYEKIREDVARGRQSLRDLAFAQMELSSLQSRSVPAPGPQLVQQLQNNVYTLQRDLRDLSTRIISIHPNYSTLVYGDLGKLRDIQMTIPKGTVALRFLPTKNHLSIFVVTRSAVTVRTSPIGREGLLSIMEEYRRLLQNPSVYTSSAGEASVPSMTQFARLSTQLYDHLIKPVEELFERNVVIIMSSEFENFPFHTIERQDKKGVVKYFVELTSVDYLPSLFSFRYKSASVPRFQTIVALGNPSGKQWSIDYELRDIRSFFKDTKILIAREATVDNFFKTRGDVLQIVSEFVVGSDGTQLGTIAFSDGKVEGQAQRLPFEQLTRLPAYPLLLLSNDYGQGVGLAPIHAVVLQMNGTADVMYNAWYAERKAAKLFSEYFYTHLANGLAVGDAYRQALLNLIRTREVSHPHSWGQFFHFGLG